MKFEKCLALLQRVRHLPEFKRELQARIAIKGGLRLDFAVAVAARTVSPPAEPAVIAEHHVSFASQYAALLRVNAHYFNCFAIHFGLIRMRPPGPGFGTR